MASQIKQQEPLANRAAENFVTRYYSAYDDPLRASKLPLLYRSDARIVWNGNAVPGPAEYAKVLPTMPFSKHEVQAYDAHVIPGSSSAPLLPPKILVTVSGQVRFSPTALPKDYRFPESKEVAPGDDPSRLPRVFSQSFMLAPVSPSSSASAHNKPATDAEYVIVSDNFRFVG